ncbi:MAG: T9SS type A sorting domain-containing protein [Saprospiraceae bacterium]|nr:T9SS type A sorting domain-containing protein [Saprospiraceae bacterium]
MSYCHLVAAGMNLEEGFGPLPGNKIRSEVNAAACLGTVHLDCYNAPFYPGGPVTASNSGGNVSASFYSCIGWNESGPERVYRLIIDEAQTITATLSGLGADLDVFILDACSENSCLAHGDVTATTATVPAGEYFVVVEGYLGAVGNFTLTVTTSVDGYCWTNGNSDEEFIAGVSMPGSGIAYTSGNGEGYSDYSSSSIFPFKRSFPASLTLTPGFAGGGSSENWSVWLDENNDQQFQASELRMSAGPSTQPVSGTVTLPASNGFTHQECRMRVKMSRDVSSNPCGDGYYGETEDYKAIIDDYCIAWPDGGMGYKMQSIVMNGNSVYSNEANYGNNFSQFFYAVRNGENTFTLTPHHTYPSDPQYSIGWRIYADLDHNYSFNDPGEMVLNLANTPDVAQSGTFTMPSGSFTGWTRFRVTMGIVNGEDACGGFVGAVYDLKVWVGDYCPTSANNSQLWIESVLLDPATGNSSGQDPNGYGDFSAQQFILDRTLTHEIRLYPAFANNTADVTWRVFIDYNHDHDFNDPGELAADLPGSPNWQIATINIPSDALNGPARMRIQMLWLVASDACGPKVMGEIEDYTVYIDPYCRANPFYNDLNWINKIAVNDYVRQTGQNAQAYTLFPDYQGRVTTAVDNYISLYPGGVNNNDAVGWRVFIDANQDGDFYDESEMVVEIPVATGDRLNVGFALPAAAIKGWTRMRVVMAEGILQGPCDIQFDGEVEDYAIYIDDYCLSHGVSSWERITNVEIGTIANYTPMLDPVMGYRDFTAQSTNLTIGEATDYSVAHSIYLYQPDNPSLTIFIDYNRDNDFNDDGERVVTEEASPASPRTGVINVPINVTPGPTRMRITIQQDYVVNHNCDIMYGRGDVSDYTVNLVTGCAVPTNIWAIPSGATAAMLGQEPQSGVNLYGYRYRAQGTNTWTTVSATVPFKSATGLAAGTTYEYQARVRCVNPAGGAGTYTAYSSSLLFTMPIANAPCGQSAAGQVRSISSTGATFQYRYVPNSTRYRVQWRALGALGWSSWEGTTTSRTVTGLTAFTTYEWQVTTRCGTTWGTPYYMGSFTTLPTLNIGGDEASDDRENAENELVEIAQQKAELVAFPNPFGESVTLQFESKTNGSATLEVRAMTGQRLMYQDVELVEGLNQLNIFTESWAAGIYYLQLYGEAGLRQVKVVKNQ